MGCGFQVGPVSKPLFLHKTWNLNTSAVLYTRNYGTVRYRKQVSFGDETGDENIVLRLYIDHILSNLLVQFLDFKYFNNINYITSL